MTLADAGLERRPAAAALGLAGRTDAGPWRAIWGRFRRDPGAMLGLACLATIVIAAMAAPLLAPYAPNIPLDIVHLKSQPPSLLHPFGTDPVSRDVLSRVVYGSRISLTVALLAALMAATVGTLYGAVAGYAGGFTDEVMMRFTDACLSIPRVLLLLTIVALWGRLQVGALVLVLGLTGWFGVSRLVRLEVLALQSREWVMAARAIGGSRARVLFRHVLPNAASPIIVSAALGVGQVILLEAGLSFLGVGIQPPNASWGTIMQDGADQIRALWWLSVFPGLAILITVMSINAVADGLLDALDPHAGRRA